MAPRSATAPSKLRAVWLPIVVSTLLAWPAFAVIEGDPTEPIPEPAVCEGQALVRSLTNETGIEVDGLHLVVYGPDALLEVDRGAGNPFGAPLHAGTDPEGAQHVRFGGATVAPGEAVRIALCFDGSQLESAPVGTHGAQYWLVGDSAVLEAPALPALGVQLVPTLRVDGRFDLHVALSQSEPRSVRIDSAEFAFGPPSLLGELESQQLTWKPLQLDTTELQPPAEGNLASLASAPIGEAVHHDDARALYVRASISTDAYPPRGDESDTEPPPSAERVKAESVYAVDLSSILQPALLEARALESAGQGYAITRRARLSLPLTGAEAWAFKLLPDDPSAPSLELALDANGFTVDPEQLILDEEAAEDLLYGTLEPSLLETIQGSAPDDPIEVAFWLALPDDDDNPDAPQRPDPEIDLSRQETDLLFAEVDTYQRQRTAEVATRFVEALAPYANDAETVDLLPMVYATLPASQIEQIASWPDVAAVSEAVIAEPDLEIALATTNADDVHTGGTTGTGERLAVIETGGGRVDTGNPFLAITVDNTKSCVSNHGAAVAGIVGSSHGTRTGFAPDAQLRIGGSCNGRSRQLKKATSRAIDWGARAINLSWGSARGRSPGSLDRTYDRFVSEHWRTVVKSAGNEAGGCRSQTGKISRPGRGYNVLTVGNFDDRNSIGWGDDQMNACSSFVDPNSRHDDREKPEVAAPGTTINSTTNASPWTGAVGSGTSYAAPVVTGGAGLLFDRHGALRWWPEAVKAIFMVTATHNVEGATRLSDRDGAGGVVLDQAVTVARDGGSRQWGGRGYTCSSPSSLDVQSFTLGGNRLARVAIVWNQRTDYWRYRSRPSADLDLRVLGPGGTVVASSSSWDNTYEIVEFISPTAGTYTIRVLQERCSKSPRWLGWAWWDGPTSHILGVSNDAQGAGLDIANLGASARPDMVLMAYHAPAGPNWFRYKIGWDLDTAGRTVNWSGVHTVAGVGWEGQGAGVEIGDLNGNGTPDMVLMAYDNPWNGNTFRYRIGWDLVGGAATWWSGTTIVPGVGWEGQGAGVELVDIDDNGTDEMVFVAYDNPWNGNTFRYRIGWNVNAFGVASWSGTTIIPGVGWEGQGAGVAAGDINGNGTTDLLMMAYDNPWNGNTFRYRIGWDVSTGGTAPWSGTTILGGVGWEADGAAPELYDIDGDGELELFLMAYDDPYVVPNTFRYRVVDP
ncbi:MAG: S8 family serine peptidase [Acidobacteriota bacterium]